MYGYLYMQLGPPQIVNQAHVLSSLILWLHRDIFERPAVVGYCDSRVLVLQSEQERALETALVHEHDMLPSFQPILYLHPPCRDILLLEYDK
jgi:hypothetical protein